MAKSCHSCRFCHVTVWVSRDRQTGEETDRTFGHACRFNAPVLDADAMSLSYSVGVNSGFFSVS